MPLWERTISLSLSVRTGTTVVRDKVTSFLWPHAELWAALEAWGGAGLSADAPASLAEEGPFSAGCAGPGGQGAVAGGQGPGAGD